MRRSCKLRWSILCLTQPSRAEFLEKLLACLRPQLRSGVGLCLRTFDPGLSIGENRQRMIEEAAGEYVGFVDDDDLVAEDYVERIFPLLDGVDYVGFQLQYYEDGRPWKPTFHSLRYGGWSDDESGYYRDISHLNPIRRELALLVRLDGARGEDKRWADAMRETGRVKTEHFVDAVLYHYYYRTAKNDGSPGA